VGVVEHVVFVSLMLGCLIERKKEGFSVYYFFYY